MDALERFRKEFKGWVLAHNRVKDFDTRPEEILERLETRIPVDTLRQIGAAYINNWLENEPEPERRYFVRESDREGKRGGQWTLEHAGEGSVNPCWELYVQLADYNWIRTVAERRGLTTRLEDREMDITVLAGENLLLYVENKVKKDDALHLFRGMKKYGKTGFDLRDPDNNPALVKAKYLVRKGSRPLYFALSAIGLEQVFRVTYSEKNRFSFHDTNLSLVEPLLAVKADGSPAPRSAVDSLALQLERLAGDRIWASPGNRQTAYNFYVPGEEGDALAVGIYEGGSVWSDLKSLGDKRAERLASELSSLGITLDTSKEWQRWRKNGQKFSIDDKDPLEIAKRVVAALFPKDG